MLLLISLLISWSVISQNNASYITNIQHFTTLDGLSHRNVRCVFQDRDDIIWLGTENGLNRFDGYHFKHWLGKNHGVDLRNIHKITQDDAGWLWIKTRNNFIFFNPKTEVFQTVTERFGKDCVLLDNGVLNYLDKQSLITDKHGRIFFYNYLPNRRLYCYHSSSGIIKISIPLKLLKNNVNEIKIEINRITDKEEIIIRRNKQEAAVMLLSKDSLIFLRNQYYNSEFIKLNNFNSYQNGLLWKYSATDAILKVYNSNQDLLLSLDEIPMSGYLNRDMYFDKKNRHWIATSFGVYLIEIKKNKFTFFEIPEYLDNKPQAVRGILVDSTEITMAAEVKDIRRFNFKSKQWSYLSVEQPTKTFYASDDELWMSANSSISVQKNGKFATYPIRVSEDGKFPTHQIWSIFPSNISSKKLWLGSEQNLLLFDKETKKTQLIANPLIKGSYHIQTIIRDKENENWLWLCSNKGLILFDEQSNQFLSVYNINQPKEQFLPTEDIQHLYQPARQAGGDEKGIYWLATADGIIRWNKTKNEYRQFTVANGLPDNVIYAIYPDDYGNLWMSSDYGIIQMNKTTFAIKNYLPEDGIGQKEFNRVSHFNYQDKNGVQRLFFGGLGGVTAFYPRDFQTNEQEIKATLTVLKYQQFDGKKKIIVDNTLSILANKKIIIQPNDYIHSLEVGLLNYDNVENNQYSYQLKINGQLSDKTTQKNRFIQFGHLPYGKHQLTITAKTLNNVSAKNDLVINIIVRRPFYLTWWFILLAITTIIGSIIYYYNYKNRTLRTKQIELETLVKERTEKIEKQSEELKKIDATKTRFFANISHELRTPITLIQGPIQSVLNRQKLTNQDFTLLSKAKQNTRKLLQLVNEILDLTKFDAHKLVLEEETIVFYTFLRSIVSSFESIADMKSIELVFIYDIPKSLQIKVDKSKLEKILNNLLSNALKFTPKNGKITVHIQDLGNVIQIEVKDNGRGIPAEDVPKVFNRFYQSSVNTKAEGGLGIGLSLSMEFVKLMDGKMWVESQMDESKTESTFYVQFPKKEVIKMITTEEQVIINNENSLVPTPIQLTKTTSYEAERETILIVEDNHDLRDYLSYLLSPHYNIITAENGKEGLEELRIRNEELRINQSPTILNSSFLITPSSLVRKAPNLILSDVMMPIMDGFEFLEKVKANAKWRSLPFIMLTARAEQPTRLKALRIGVDDYLLKPFDEEELLVRVKNLLANYKERIAINLTETKDNKEKSKEIIISEADQEWLIILEQLIFKEMDNSIFSVDFLAESLAINRKTLYNKIKQLTGLTPTKYIRAIRLQKAKNLLENGTAVNKVAQQVGFQNTEYFSTLFKANFGKSPSYYKK